MFSRIRDLTGQRFGKLTAIGLADNRNKSGRVTWKVECDCGNISCVESGNLTSGHTRSCGCLNHAILDLSGMRFGKLVALELVDKKKNNQTAWKCQCDCGNVCYIRSGSLTSGHSKSCGCSHASDLTGMRFGRLVAIEPTGRRSGGSIVWKAKCDCGNFSYVSSNHLSSGHTRSCGCLFVEIMKARKGSLHPNWNPELTDEEREDSRKSQEYIEWRKFIFERDNYICKKCGERGGKLNAHHVEAYANNKELRLEAANGVTLCETCHDLYHHIYGNHSTREKFEEYMEGNEF